MQRQFHAVGSACLAALLLFTPAQPRAQVPAPPVAAAPASTTPGSEPAVTPPPTDTEAVESAAAAGAPPADAPAPVSPTAPPAKAVLLPIEFNVYERGVGAGEVVPDWTNAARTNLGGAAVEVLNERAGLQLVAMPDLSPEEQKVLREHIALFELIVFQANDLKGGVWVNRRADFDRAFGDGLRFLHDKSGADYAIVIDGTQVKQSGGSVFAQIAMAALGVVAPGGGTFIFATLVDLQKGEVKWFNVKTGVEVMGFTGSDVRAPDEAKETLRKLFAPYPVIPALGHE